jgi:quinoprotein glucose dehydrogenase
MSKKTPFMRTPFGGLETVPPWPRVDPKTSTDWRAVGGDAGGSRHSPLTQISRRNVARLKPVWTFACGDSAAGSTIECTPIVVDGVMFIVTVSQKVIALDAATGTSLWQFDPRSRGVHRGLAYWTDGDARRILFGTGTGMLISLDARTGKPDRAFGNDGVVALRDGYRRDLSKMTYGVTSAVAVCGDRVIVPIINSESQPGASGDIRAFDVRTGRERWRFHTVPQPGEVGNDTWATDSWKERSGTNPWAGFTVDERRQIVFCGIGSAASDFYGADRHGENLFANCVVALDGRTGKRLWHFQTVHHDLWDHDTPCPPVLVTVRRGGKTIDAVAQPTKTGFIYVFERTTGRPLFPVHEVPAPASTIPGERAHPTQPEPIAPPRLSPGVVTQADLSERTPQIAAELRERVKSLVFGRPYQPPSREGTIVAPGFHGGANWSGASFDPTRGLLFINTNHIPSILQLKENADGGYDFQGYQWFRDRDGFPAVKPPWGHLTAVDLSAGRFAWRIPFGAYPALTAQGARDTGSENFGGTIVTAGGLVFIGATPDEKFHAYDRDTGRLLWEWKLPAGGYATPCTYAVNGRQFVVIAAGGGGKLGTRSGDQFIAFALP